MGRPFARRDLWDELAQVTEFPRLPSAPRRVVSLVPSTTETLFDLGLDQFLVGRTDFCTRPKDRAGLVPSVGGTRNPDLDRIRQLQPDLVLANREENTEQVVRRLQGEGIPTWVAFPKTVREAVSDLRWLASFFASPRALWRVDLLEKAVEWQEASMRQKEVGVFCPIWRARPVERPDWYMTFNRETYAHDLLRLCGGRNVFADRERRYPLAADLGKAPARPFPERDRRYPRVALEEIQEARPEVVLLPDEPFVFGEADATSLAALLPGVPAVREGRICRVDGSLLFWHGTRMARSLQVLPALFR